MNDTPTQHPHQYGTSPAWDMATEMTLSRAVGANANSHLRNDTFLEFRGRKVTFGEFAAAVDKVSELLIDRGVRPGNRVLINLPSTDKYLVAAYSILRVGAVYVTSGWDYTRREVEYQLAQSGAIAIITDRAKVTEYDLAELVERPTNDLRLILTADVEDASVHGDLERALAGPDTELDLPWPASADLAMIMYTSGTTSRPKGVMWSHGNLYVAAAEQAMVSDFRPGDRLLHMFPFHHAGGGVGLQAPMLLIGGTLVLERFWASGFGELLCRHEITVTALNASHVKMIVRAPETECDSAHRLRVCLFGLPIAESDAAEFDRRFGVRLIGRYGLTESLGLATTVPQNGLWRPPNNCGVPHPGVQLRIVDDASRDLPTGEVGQILIRRTGRHGHCLGYYRDAEASAQLLTDGWIYSGDLGSVDADGYLHFVGRKDFQVKRSGYNISPREVESVVDAMPEVRESCVVAIPDPVREMALILYYECEQGSNAEPDQVLSICRDNLASYKVPQFVAKLDQLPVDVLGKVSMATLRERAVAEFGAAVARELH